MSIRKKRSDAGTKRTPPTTERESMQDWFADQDADTQDRILEDFALIQRLQQRKQDPVKAFDESLGQMKTSMSGQSYSAQLVYPAHEEN